MRRASPRFPTILLLLTTVLACREGASPGIDERRDQGGSGDNVGTLRGDVYFVGVPCPLIYPPRPPCDGPYPDYEVIVLQSDAATEAARIRSDSAGVYRVALAAGDYVIFTPRGIDPAIKRRNEARVVTGETTRLDLLVDTGIR